MSETSLAGLQIGLVGPLPPPAGGMANQTQQLAELLRAARASVWLVQSNAPYQPAWLGRVPMLRALVRLLPYLHRLWQATGRSDVLHVMANSGWSWHLFAVPAIWIGWVRRVPVIINYRGGEAGDFLRRSGRVVRWSMARIARLVVPSGFLKQVFGQHGMVADIVPNIIDVQRFHPAAAEADAAPHVMVARNLEPIYDNPTALRAFALVLKAVPQARLTVAGTGPEAGALQRLAQELGIASQVSFVGRQDRDGMAALYRRSHVSLNPSRVDNMPNSVLESMASGVPVVSTRVGGVPFIVEDRATALLVPPQQPEAMAAAILELLQDRALAERLATAALQEVQRYTWNRVAPVLADVYRSALRQRG